MKIEDTLSASLLETASKLLENNGKVDPKKLDPDLDGIPANTKHKEGSTQLPAEPSNLKPEEIEAKLKESAVSGEPILSNSSIAKAASESHGATGEGVARGLPAEPSHLNPSKAEHDMHESTPPGMEAWVRSNKERFKSEYGSDWERILYSTAWAMKKHESVSEGVTEIVPAEKSHLDPSEAEKKMAEGVTQDEILARQKADEIKEDDEDDASHGKEASGKVANADGIARESVEMVAEELDKNLDPQTAEVADRNRPPKGAHLVHEQSIGARGIRMQLEWANGKALILPPASEPALSDIAACLEYVAEHFADRPDWIEAIEKSLLD